MEAEYETEAYDTDEAWDASESDANETEEVDAMLDALMEEAEQDVSERHRGRRSQPRRQGVTTARGGTPYRPPAEEGYVSQKQFKEAMARVGDETRRNAEGIKTVNARVGTLDTRVDDVVKVSKSHSSRIGTLDTRMKLDGALDFATSFTVQAGADGARNLALDPSQLLRGVVKNGLLGDPKGAMANPWLIGGIGVLLKNPGILGGVLSPTP